MFQISCFESSDSTNDEARRLYAERRCPQLVYASEQRKGRGRLGREWDSPRGNLYLSVCLKPVLQSSEWPFFSIKVAVVLADCLTELGLKNLCLKWPNDCLLAGRKLAGILLEKDKDIKDKDILVMGMGINIIAAPPGAARLVDSLPDISLSMLVQKLIPKLENALQSSDKREHWSDRWNTYAYGLGEMLRIYRGKDCQQGVFQGINDRGEACLFSENGIVLTLNSGEAFFGIATTKEIKE